MKRLKISMLAICAIVLGLVASAFTVKHNPNSIHPTTLTWFSFSGSDPTDVTQVNDYMNYTWTDGQACSGTTNKICAVQVSGVASPGQHQSSSFSSTLKSDLQKVINNGNSYPDITQRVQ